MESIVIVGIVVVLAVWWARLVAKQNGSEKDDPERSTASGGDDPERGTVSGGWHPAGVEYGTRLHELEVERERPTPGLCLACGTENDPFYTYCRNCVERLDQL